MTPRVRPPARLALSLAMAVAVALWTGACAGRGGGPVSGPPATAAEADELLASGDVAAAAALYEGLSISGPEPDRALLMLAVLELDSSAPTYDPETAFARLERVRDEYPSGPWAVTARALLALRGRARALEAEVARLGRQLEEIKRIDLDPPGR